MTELRENRSTLQKLSNHDCLQAYRNELVSDRQDVLAISSATSTDSSVISYWPNEIKFYSRDPGAEWNPYRWTCTQSTPELCPYPTQNWTVLGSPIEYCLSKQIKPDCRLQLSLVIMISVKVCNFVKILCMGLTIWEPSSTPLLSWRCCCIISRSTGPDYGE